MVIQIAMGRLETPIGALWTACSAQGICKLVFPREGGKGALDRWVASHWPDCERLPTSPFLAQADAEIGEYFTGMRQTFTVPLDLHGPGFQRRVWQALTAIPYGQTVSYGGLARTLRIPNGARAVGAACGANPVPIIAPCHRVLGSDGSLHGFGGGLAVKAWLLRHEGVLLDL
jgi:O-6-methylguanine DNA methyltransferase